MHAKALFLGILAALTWLCGSVQAQELPFPVTEAGLRPVDKEQVFDAVIEAVHQSTISAQTSGRVSAIYFDVDDYVSKDSVLLRIRDKEQRAALKSAQARHKEAKAEFNRIADVFAKKLVAKSAYDKAEAAFNAASAALEQAQEELDHTVVKAPFSGIVVKREIEVGESASPGRPLMTGLSLEHLRATASVPERHIATVRALSRARVILPGDGVGSIEGGKLTISPYADPSSHTFKVRVDLPPGQLPGIYPGMFAKVAFVTGQAQRLLVPEQAVAYRSEVTAVYTVDAEGRVSFRQVRVGRVLGDGQIEVLAGLDPGERVALDPIRAGVYLKQMRSGEGR